MDVMRTSKMKILYVKRKRKPDALKKPRSYLCFAGLTTVFHEVTCSFSYAAQSLTGKK